MTQCFTLLLAALLGASTAAAQDFFVAASTPAAGDSSVALQTQVTFTFSAPLDTTARFGGALPVHFYTISPPDSLRIDNIGYSDDLTRVTFDVAHTPDTDFTWILTGARDQAGTLVCSPYALSYTTAPNRGRRTVHGSAYALFATKHGVCNAGPITIVATLWDAPPQQGGQAKAAVVAGIWEYTLTGIREGTYYPVYYMDSDQDGRFNPDWGAHGSLQSEVAFPRPTPDPRDVIVVADQDITDLDVEFYGSAGVEDGAVLPGVAALLQNFPNPFATQTTLAFDLERPVHLRMAVYDVLGRHIDTVQDGLFLPGRHATRWDARGLPGGVYLVRLEGDTFRLTRLVMHAR